MAQNWVVTPRKTRALRLLDALAAPIAALGRARRRGRSLSTERILVVEAWQLGDAVLAEPFLRTLRERFPRASITLLCKPSTRTLLEPSRLVDRYVVAELPWTSFTGKYAPRRYVDGALAALVRELRRERFDLSIDARGDVRANVLTWLTGATHRVGFDAPGSRLLTHRVAGPSDATHKVEDWLAMLEPLGGVPKPSAPRLVIDADAAARVARALEEQGIDPADRLVVIHASARQDVRRWPLERFHALAAGLVRRGGVRVLAITDPDGYGASLGDIPGVVVVRPSLAELPAYLAAGDLFVGNDSGPAHVAAAVGTPTVTIFGPQIAGWYRPYGDGHTVVQIDEMWCRPCFDQCIRHENVCITGIDVDRVAVAVHEALAAIESDRPPRRFQLTSAGAPGGYFSSL